MKTTAQGSTAQNEATAAEEHENPGGKIDQRGMGRMARALWHMTWYDKIAGVMGINRPCECSDPDCTGKKAFAVRCVMDDEREGTLLGVTCRYDGTTSAEIRFGDNSEVHDTFNVKQVKVYEINHCYRGDAFERCKEHEHILTEDRPTEAELEKKIEEAKKERERMAEAMKNSPLGGILSSIFGGAPPEGQFIGPIPVERGSALHNALKAMTGEQPGNEADDASFERGSFGFDLGNGTVFGRRGRNGNNGH